VPKIAKITLYILLGILVLLLILLGIVQTSAFKNYAVDKATAYLSKELKAEVSIGSIDIRYLDRINVNNVLLRDQQKDTMIFVSELKANYRLFSFSSEKYTLDKVLLNNADVRIGIPEGSKELNLQFLVDYFTPDVPNPEAVAPVLQFNKVTLINGKFNYFNRNLPKPSERDFNENNFEFRAINGDLQDFTIIEDSLTFTIKDLSSTEKSGLKITHFEANSIISRSLMQFENLQLTTPKSRLQNKLLFKYTSYNDFSDFFNAIWIDANLQNSKIHLQDIAFFSDILKKYNEEILASGKVTGYTKDLKIENGQISIGQHTTFAGDAQVKNIPYTDNLNIQFTNGQVSTIAKKFSAFIDWNAPEEFLRLDKIKYNGSFNGGLQKFVNKGLIETSLGNCDVDLELNLTNESYEAVLVSDNLNLGKMLAVNHLGTTAFDLAINGQGLNLQKLKSGIKGNIAFVEYNDYRYTDIAVNGAVIQGIFDGLFTIEDENYNFSFTGNVDATQEEPSLKIETDVQKINLKTLGIDTKDALISFKGGLDFSGSNIDNTIGTINLTDVALIREGRNINLGKINLTAEGNIQNRELTLNSDVANLKVYGSYTSKDFPSIFDQLLHGINPDSFPLPKDSITAESITVAGTLFGYHPVVQNYLPDIAFDSLSTFTSYNQIDGKLTSTNKLHHPKLSSLNTEKITLKITNGGLGTPYNISVNTTGLNQKDSILFNEFNALGYVENSIVYFEINSKKDTILNIALNGRYTYTNDSSLVYLDESKLNIFGKKWELNQSDFPNLIYANGVTDVRYLDLRSNQEILFVDASIGNESDKLNIILSNFTVNNLKPFLAGYNLDLDGLANGYIDVSNREGYPIIEGDLVIDNLQLNKDTLGNLVLYSKSIPNILEVALNGRIEGGLLNAMQIDGNINFENEASPLDLQLTTERSNIRPFEKYLVGLASNIQGFSTTKIDITGPLSAPKLKGTMQLEELNFVVDYLQTAYTGNALVDISYNAFSLREAKLVDRFKKEAVVSGNVKHTNFGDYQFDLAIKDLNSFEIMNTTRNDNELFYGSAYVDGNMKIKGPLDDILLQINAKSRKGTKIAIPLDYFETSGNLSYVTFVDLNQDVNAKEKTFEAADGVRMDFNFEITNDAKIELIFDELLGDKIDAAGHGNLRMEINTFGDFNMYGGITIDEGTYNFTAFDLINKYFVVAPGGTLFWDGNPYNATIDIDASKREYTVPKILLQGVVTDEAELEKYNEAIPVDCYLQLEGMLVNPEVSFDIAFPTQNAITTTGNTSLNTVIERIKADQEELNRQVFALLVLGSFVPTSFASGAGDYTAGTGLVNTGVNSLSDFASSQLNNLVSQLDSRWQVGFDYQQGIDEADRTELILSLKRKFFNDRLELAYSVDAAANADERPFDLSIQYNLNPDGNLKVRGFTKNANDPTLGSVNLVSTTGFGLFYRYQFDKFIYRKKRKPIEQDSTQTKPIENP
jgi:hypothetical protein